MIKNNQVDQVGLVGQAGEDILTDFVRLVGNIVGRHLYFQGSNLALLGKFQKSARQGLIINFIEFNHGLVPKKMGLEYNDLKFLPRYFFFRK